MAPKKENRLDLRVALKKGAGHADWETAQGNAPIIEGEMGDLGAE